MLKNEYAHLSNICIDPPSPGGIHLIIGTRDKHLIRPKKQITSDKHLQPDAQLSELGWTISGAFAPAKSVQIFNFHAAMKSRITTGVQAQLEDVSTAIENACGKKGSIVPMKRDLVLENLLERAWNISEPAAPKDPFSPQDRELLAYMEENIAWNSERSRYEVPILWKDGEPNYVSNRYTALKRLDNLLETSLADPVKYAAYKKIFDTYQAEGFLSIVPREELDLPHRYLPHFPVFKANDPTKVRPVMDAKAKSNGKSLNDGIHQGPNLMNDIRSVLQRFRRVELRSLWGCERYVFTHRTSSARRQLLQSFMERKERATPRSSVRLTSLRSGQ